MCMHYWQHSTYVIADLTVHANWMTLITLKVLALCTPLCSWYHPLVSSPRHLSFQCYNVNSVLHVTLKGWEGLGTRLTIHSVLNFHFINFVLWLFFAMSVPTVQTPEIRADIESKLSRQLSQRPTKMELQQKNIIPRDKSVRDQEFEDRKVLLERKLSRRPTVKELREKRILMYVAMGT